MYLFFGSVTTTECLRIGAGNRPQEDRRVLRWLQERRRERIGGSGEISPDRTRPSLPCSSDADKDERQTLFLISNYRGGLQHPGVTYSKNIINTASRSHPSSAPGWACTLRHRRAWNHGRSSDGLMLHHYTSAFLIFQQQKRNGKTSSANPEPLAHTYDMS